MTSVFLKEEQEEVSGEAEEEFTVDPLVSTDLEGTCLNIYVLNYLPLHSNMFFILKKTFK